MKNIFPLLLALLLFPAIAAAQDYRLDDANGVEFALYAGGAYKSSVDPKDSVSSLPELESRMKQLPAQSRIYWTPARYTATGVPLLFGHAEDAAALEKFSAAQGITLDITPPVCKNSEGCAGFCKGAGLGKECVPDGIPYCEKDRCSCALTCR